MVPTASPEPLCTMTRTALMAEQGGIRLQRLVVRWRAYRDVCVAIVRALCLTDHRCQSHADESTVCTGLNRLRCELAYSS